MCCLCYFWRDICDVGHRFWILACSSFYKKIKNKSPYGAYVIHQVALAGFQDDLPKIEQSDAQFSKFTDSAGLFKDHFFRISIPPGHCNK
jgi:hypothetical protein